MLTLIGSALLLGYVGVALLAAGDAREGQQAALTTGTPEALLPLILKPEATPTLTPTATLSPGPSWLGYLNLFREMAGLPHLAENTDWSSGAMLHSRYMVKEDAITHSENSSSPWYTAEGALAGASGNIFVSGWMNTPDEAAIDWWMTAPFHAVAIIDPRLQVTGLGSYRENIGFYKMGATVDVQRGRGTLPPGYSFPVMFPKDGGQTWLTRFYGGEWPDPLISCPGYAAPTGPAIILQLGSGSLTPTITASGFVDNSGSLEYCLLTETNYTNPDSASQNSGRIILGNRDAVVILPRLPLTVGQTYTATATSDGNPLTWHFSVTSPPVLGLQAMPVGTHVEGR